MSCECDGSKVIRHAVVACVLADACRGAGLGCVREPVFSPILRPHRRPPICPTQNAHLPTQKICDSIRSSGQPTLNSDSENALSALARCTLMLSSSARNKYLVKSKEQKKRRKKREREGGREKGGMGERRRTQKCIPFFDCFGRCGEHGQTLLEKLRKVAKKEEGRRFNSGFGYRAFMLFCSAVMENAHLPA